MAVKNWPGGTSLIPVVRSGTDCGLIWLTLSLLNKKAKISMARHRRKIIGQANASISLCLYKASSDLPILS